MRSNVKPAPVVVDQRNSGSDALAKLPAQAEDTPNPVIRCSRLDSLIVTSAAWTVPPPHVPLPESAVDPGLPESAVDPGLPESAVDPGLPESAVDPGLPESLVDPGLPESCPERPAPSLVPDPESEEVASVPKPEPESDAAESVLESVEAGLPASVLVPSELADPQAAEPMTRAVNERTFRILAGIAGAPVLLSRQNVEQAALSAVADRAGRTPARYGTGGTAPGLDPPS
jgi:hypothetical protein